MVLQTELENQGNWLFRRRSLLPLLVLALGLATQVVTFREYAVSRPALLSHWHLYEWGCLAVGIAGLWVRAYTVGFTPEGTSGRNTACQVADSLNTTGIYSVVRHPLYVGNFLMWLSVALLTCNDGFVAAFVLAYWLYYERIMYAEEQFLTRKFGEAYTSWAQHTPAIVPCFKHFKRSALPYSWKKVLKKEKNGVFALLLLFSVFDAITAQLSGQTEVNMPLLALTVASGIAYLVLKYLKRRTSLLDEQGR